MSCGDLTDQYTYTCPCFEEHHIPASQISKNGSRKQMFRCPTCKHDLSVVFTHNELGAFHYFQCDYESACLHYEKGFESAETTKSEYIFNLHESLNLWSRPESRERLEPMEAKRRLEEALSTFGDDRKFFSRGTHS
jgi:hypothetical protein